MCAWLLLLAVLPTFAGWRGHTDLCCAAELPAELRWSPAPPPPAPAHPVFAPATTTLLATRGGNITLYCTVLGLQDKTVSWIRSRDLQILAHGGSVFTGDSRVSAGDSRLTPAEYHLTPGEALLTPTGLGGSAGEVTHWLTLDKLRNGDAGKYECQLNTEPKMSLFYNLTVLDSAHALTVHISGPRIQRVASPARLQCEASLQAPGDLPTLPEPVWYYEGQPLELPEGVSVSATRWAGGARCTLLLRGAARRAGRYTCHVQDRWDSVKLELDEDNELQDPGSEWMQRDQSLTARVYGAGGATVSVPGCWYLIVVLATLVFRW